MLRGKCGLELHTFNCNLACVDPRGRKLQILIIIEELKSFVDTEGLKSLIILLLERLLKREVCDILAE
jgi:hypothetical protein